MTYLNHLIFALGVWGANRDIIARHADDALDSLLVGEDGDIVENQVANFYTTSPPIGHVGSDPVAVDGEGGKHGRAMGGRDLEAMGEGEMDGASDFEGGDGKTEGMA